MLYVITGGSGSGKSEYAERVAAWAFAALNGRRTESGMRKDVTAQREDIGTLYYVATMKPYDEECLKRIARHREMRKEKGFTTLERPCRIEKIRADKRDVLLLEDLSNLLANEQYLEEGRVRGKKEEAQQRAAEAILHPILALSRQAGCMVVVTNEIFSDGIVYEEETENYCRLLGFLNRELAKAADGVAEVVCSIPVSQKGELPC